MPNTFTTHYNFIQPEVGGDSDAWGGHLNSSLESIDAQLWLRVRSDVPQTLTQPLTLTGQTGMAAGLAVTQPAAEASLTAYDTAIKKYISNRIAFMIDNYVLPIGTIIAWAGTFASIPYGWIPCSGGTAGGVTAPDLSERFVLHAYSTRSPGTVGGVSLATLENHGHGFQSIKAGTGPTGTFYNGPVNVAPPYYALIFIMRYRMMQTDWPP